MLLYILLLPLLLSARDVSELCLHHASEQPVLLVSRLDGVISAVQLTPDLKVLWELDLGYPLLSSSKIILEDNTLLIPSLDGNLYTLSRKHSTISPYSQLETLLNKESNQESGSKWVGGKVVTTRGVSPTSGRVLYSCNIDNCKKLNDSSVGVEPMLAITDERRTVRLLDMRLGVERWNWSISSVELQYIGVKHRSSCLPPDLPAHLSFDVERGVVRALFGGGAEVSVDLPGPLSQAWVLNDEYLQSVNMFFTGPGPAGGAGVNIYLGTWQGNHYVQPFKPHESWFRKGGINKEVFEVGHVIPGRAGRDTITWEHPHTTTTEDSSTALAPINPQLLQHDRIWRPSSDWVERGSPGGAVEEVPDLWSTVESLGATAMFGVIIAFIVYRKMFKRKRKLTTTSTETDEPMENHSPPIPLTPLLSPNATAHFNFDNITTPFESRFELDFIVIRELGQGGFGKVLEAKHKISEHNYAIKIIKLPRKEELKKKVEREVAAMAKLEHPNILRYYTSWKETPSAEWTRTRTYTMTSGDSELGLTCDSGTTRDSGTTSFSWSEKRSGGVGESESIVFQNEQSDSIEFLEQSRGTEESESIVFADSTSPAPSSMGVAGPLEKGVAESPERGVAGCAPRGDLHLSLGTTTTSSHDSGDSTWSSDEDDGHTDRQTDSFLYIQMQLCSDVTLKEWLLQNPERQGMLRIFSEIVSSVEYIHSHNHIHRDLKPSNILFSEDGTVKVADFGLATVMSNVTITPTDGGIGLSPGFEGPSMTQNLGTKLYMAPELETDSHYDYKVDIFALGVILFELLVVFDTGMERVELIQRLRSEHEVPASLDTTFPKYKLILLQMIATNPADRPTALEVRKFFNNPDCDTILDIR